MYLLFGYSFPPCTGVEGQASSENTEVNTDCINTDLRNGSHYTQQLCLRRRPVWGDLPSHSFKAGGSSIFLICFYLILFSFHTVASASLLFCVFLFPFPCYLLVRTTPGSLQDMVTKYQRRKNKMWEPKKHPLFPHCGYFLFFVYHWFQLQERIMQYSLSFQFVLLTIALCREAIWNQMKKCDCDMHVR